MVVVAYLLHPVSHSYSREGFIIAALFHCDTSLIKFCFARVIGFYFSKLACFF